MVSQVAKSPGEETDSGRAPNLSVDFATAEGETFDVAIRPHPGTRVARLTTPNTEKQRHLEGAMFDMKRVADLCREYVAATEADASRPVQDALWMSAVVLYARCFNGGVRQRVDTSILDSVPGDAQKAHEHFIDLRDKFVAHSVNAYEQTLAYAVVSSDTGDVLSTGTLHLWANPMNQLGAQTLETLAWAFYNSGRAELDQLGVQVRHEADALGSAAIAALPDLVVETPHVASANRRRS